MIVLEDFRVIDSTIIGCISEQRPFSISKIIRAPI